MEDKIMTTEQLVAGGEDIRIRQMSAEICEQFEDLLSAHNILIPDEERAGDEGEACIYGETYSDLEDAVTDLLATLVEIVRKHPDKPINTEEY